MKFLIRFHGMFTLILFLIQSALGQFLIPKEARIDWPDAGLIKPVSTADTVININDYKGSDDEKIVQALKDAKRLSGITIIYFPAGIYSFSKPINLNTKHSGIVSW